MHYVSTRGEAPKAGFDDVILAGLAPDGGLYVPESWPQFSPDDIREMRGASYETIAERVIAPFVGDTIDPETLRAMIREAYATFRHPAIAPLAQSGANTFLMELFHGPTLAFKDVAMQLLARLMDHVLAERGERATIVGATSGDTGGAAIDAFAGSNRTDVYILFPEGKVSPVQRRQMTTHGRDNVHAIAVKGDFDDCQSLVKAMFNDRAFRGEVGLSGVNSINWARIMAQIVYYFTAAVTLGAPERTVSFTVPTGNFGDIFAGYAAKRMGLGIERLVIATNENDILARALASGRYERQGVVTTTSPSMDIQVSSNFERLLFCAGGEDPAAVRTAMDGLAQAGAFTIDPAALREIRRDFSAGRAGMCEADAVIRDVATRTGAVLDPHTAVALTVARDMPASRTPMVVLSTAHPAKFPDAVKAACGIDPALPPWLCDLMNREEQFDVLANDLDAVQALIRKTARAGDANAR
ncbi:threonine synthase [Pararhizobium mangrovi]|uniref:Threonine synthase n=1 Tax=Pararhizobium mangrovi TaxID=2590452 RepID=A0A506U2W5_9HYPH|nr:threonine synthase [Pararhizobium mangrovi]TPW28693.1 threonine synthase [Pararhizobium mangrovi]